MTFLLLGKSITQASVTESADCIIRSESCLVALFGVTEMASAAARTAPMRYAKDENCISSSANSRDSKSSSVWGTGMSFGTIS